jgi:transposase-like protein
LWWFSGRTRGEPDIGKLEHSEEEILRVLREAESGDTVVELCIKHGISQQTFYLWKKKEKHCSVPENGQNLALEREHSPANFIEEPGVLKLGHKETKYKRRYITLRIPERIALRVHRRLQVLP